MPVEYSREIIGDGIGLTLLKDKKFKTNAVSVRFLTKLASGTASANAAASSIIVSSNSSYPTRTELTKKVASLYGAAISTSNGKIGDMQCVEVKVSGIRDEYALEGEKITEELTGILLDCIFRPVVENGGFGVKEFNIRKQELIDYIDSAVNDKMNYTVKKAYETVFRGEPYELNAYGLKEEAEKLDPAGTYNAYKYLLRSGRIEIIIAGGGDLTSAVKQVKEAFAKLERENVEPLLFDSPSPVKEKRESVTERMDVNQCKMIMAYKSSYKDIYVLKLMSALLGGTAFSKLFLNVREKLSLCYFCSSRIIDGKGTLVVNSGVDKCNIEKAKEAIDKQLKDLADGNFTNEELENAKLALINDIRSGYDGLNSLISWYFVQFSRGHVYSCDELIKVINSITREQIIESAGSFRPDTVFVLESSGQEQGGGN